MYNSKDLNQLKLTKIIKKGKDIKVDSYSGFYDNDYNKSTGLTNFLNSKNIKEIEIVGLALDYCVKFTALDAVKDGFITHVHYIGKKAVNLNKNDFKNSIIELLNNKISILA